MSRQEALRTKLDAVQVENERLEAENACLRDREKTTAAASDGGNGGGEADMRLAELEEERTRLTSENSKLTQLYEGVLQETQKRAGEV